MMNVGACIYCGDQKGPLSREHILARGLGGNAAPHGYSDAFVLQLASCENCRKITERIENECLVSMLNPARAKLGLKRKDRAKAQTTALIDYFDGASKQLELDWSDVPGPVIIPSFYEASAFKDGPVSTLVPCDYKIIMVAPSTSPMPDGVRRIGVSLTANPKRFGQMLAKIALGTAVETYGISGFEPLVQNFILNAPEECGRWVGGYAGTSRVEPKTSAFHIVELIRHAGPLGNYILVEIRLFAEFGGPTNYVVVGKHL